MISELLKKRIEIRFGRPVLYSKDCEVLSAFIGKYGGKSVSPATIKRLYGMTNATTEPRLYTLDLLAQFAGFINWNSMTAGDNHEVRNDDGSIKKLFTNMLKPDQVVTIKLNNEGYVVLQSHENSIFTATHSTLSKLRAGDVVKILLLENNFPLCCEKVIRENKYLSAFSTENDILVESIQLETIDTKRDPYEIPVISYSTDSTLTITKVNSAFLKVFDYTQEEILGRNVSELMNAKTIAGLEERVLKLKQGQSLNNYLGEFLNKNGSIVNVYGVVIPNMVNGKYFGAKSLFRQVNLPLSDNEHLSDHNQDSSLVPAVAIVDFDYKVLYINSDSFAFPNTKNANGKKLTDLIPGFQNSIIFQHYKYCIEKRKRIEFTESYTNENHITRLMNISVEPIRDGILILTTFIG